MMENTCPAPTNLFDKLVFWTLGYGGWMGVALLPVVWSLPVSKTVRTFASVLLVPTSAFVVTAAFSAFYMFSLFLYNMASIMISPTFLHSCLGIVCIGVGSVGMFVASGRVGIRIQVDKDAQESEGESEGSEGESEGSEGESEGSEGSQDESEGSQDESEESQEESHNDSEGSVEKEDGKDDSWRKEANFEGLRKADPLPE